MILKVWVIEKYLTNLIPGEFPLIEVKLGTTIQYFLFSKGNTNEILELNRLEKRNIH